MGRKLSNRRLRGHLSVANFYLDSCSCRYFGLASVELGGKTLNLDSDQTFPSG